MTGAAARLMVHASCVACEGRGVLIMGPSGAGKSSLALQMIGLGARLVADDQVMLERRDDRLIATCPAAIAGLIEARGLGILRAPAVPEAEISLVADLGCEAGPRLPDRHAIVLLGVEIDLVASPVLPHLPVGLMLYVQGGRQG